MIRMRVVKMTPNEERRGEGLIMMDDSTYIYEVVCELYEEVAGGDEQLQSAMNRLAARVNRARNRNKGA